MSAKRVDTVRVGVDTGGTFTDIVCLDRGKLRFHKLPSTPDDPARAVVEGLQQVLGDVRGRRVEITYGTTIATNAVLERKGARAALVTTAGFEDLIEIGRQTRPDLYCLEPRKPEPLVPRSLRLGLAERTLHNGKVLHKLSARAVRETVRALRKLGAEAVAVCFLHSYANPRHERQVGAALRRAGLSCSLSHELAREYREYERFSTAVANAYVAPVVERHLYQLAKQTAGAELRIMQSNGGAISAATAGREAVRTLLSGPAAGVMGAIAVGRRAGVNRLISFDMGGTSTDVSLIDGEPRLQTEWTIAGIPIKVPAIDIHTVGAGGGSIAYCDPGGALKVGPESAGANPGPACFGRGTRPTVTDANLLLGRLLPDSFLGGRMWLDAARSRMALLPLARQLGLTLERTCEGIIEVVNASMERAIRRISVERGHDPRDYVIVAFGGAAGMHACELAMNLGCRRVLLPYHPGLLSAFGAASAAIQRDYVCSIRRLDPPPEQLAGIIESMRTRAVADVLRESGGEGRVEIHAALDMRYRGQSYEITIPMSRDYRGAFHREHEKLYGYCDRDRAVEVVHARLLARIEPPPAPPATSPRELRQPCAYRFRWGGRWLRAVTWTREALPRDKVVRGPAVITEFSSTAIVPPHWKATVGRSGEVWLEWEKR